MSKPFKPSFPITSITFSLKKCLLFVIALMWESGRGPGRGCCFWVEMPQEACSCLWLPSPGKAGSGGRERGVALCAGTWVPRVSSFKGEKVRGTSQDGKRKGTRNSWSALSSRRWR